MHICRHSPHQVVAHGQATTRVCVSRVQSKTKSRPDSTPDSYPTSLQELHQMIADGEATARVVEQLQQQLEAERARHGEEVAGWRELVSRPTGVVVAGVGGGKVRV